MTTLTGVYEILVDQIPEPDSVLELYDAVGWLAYTRDPTRLLQGLHDSLRVCTAYDRERLIGLARVVGDGATIIYLQDILVHPDYHRQGIGQALLDAVFEPFMEVRQHVLLTDTDDSQKAFYEATGFSDSMSLGVRSFVRYQT